MNEAKRARMVRWLQGEGIEIGALHQPLAVPAGVRVTYVDHLPDADLKTMYDDIADKPFAPVSIIAGAEDLSPIADRSQDFVIANHLLEHLEDPVRGLLEFGRVLKPDGVLYLALPDKRQSFDRDRDLTPAEEILEDHRRGPERSRQSHYADWARHVDKVTEAEIAARVEHILATGYSIHFHVWRPETFLEFFLAARREFELDFDLAEIALPEHENDDEFILILLKGRTEHARFAPVPIPAARPVPAPAVQRLKKKVLATPLGPPLRAVRRRLRRG